MEIKKLEIDDNLDGIILSSMKSIKYYTHFNGSTAIGLISDNIYLFVDGRYTLQAIRDCKDTNVQIITIPKGNYEKLYSLISKQNLKNIGIEDLEISVNEYNLISKELEACNLNFLGAKLQKQQMIKTTKEIDCIKKGCQILDNIFDKVVKNIHDFDTEIQIGAYIEYQMKLLGSEGFSFDTIVAYKENSAFPHWKASSTKLGKDGFLKIDFGCYINGYGSDMTRTIYLGKASKRDKDIYHTVLEAQKLAIEYARDGVSTREIDKIARDYITSKGYGSNFIHGLGHGLGIAGGELPYLSNISEEIILREGMVVTIEPGIYIKDYGGVRIEDDILITKNGCEVLNSSTKELIEIY